MLRTAFLALFAGQVVVALLVAVAVVAVAGRQHAPSTLLGAVLVAVALGQWLLAVGLGRVGTRQVRRVAQSLASLNPTPTEGPGADAVPDHDHRALRRAREAALSNVLLAGVLLSTPAWFAVFAWATGQSVTVVTALGAVLALGYAVGIVQAGATAASVTRRVARSLAADG